MLFNSIEFLIFFPIVFVLYWFAFNKSLRWQNILILVASYFFYGWWSWKFMGLLMLSTALDYVYGFWVASENRKKAKFYLWLSIINNLGILAIFKYYNFFITQFTQGLQYLGFHFHPLILELALPIGISFYTFHGLSYVFDIYKGKQKPISNFIDYALFVSFFPLLVAGPIERANHLLPQVQKPRLFNLKQATDGCRLILWGLFKKIVIADTLAISVDQIFENYQSYNGITLATGAIAFSFQIYGDFSGYSDIAIGTAKLLGFELLSNFKFPYFSRDIAEFWRRWHISLSSWFKDYLYIPLGGSKNGKLKAIFNTFIIFLVSGFWHGASWNFIIWGFIHACGFLPLLLLNKNRKHTSDVSAQNRLLPTVKELYQMLSTFCFVSFAWIFFRIDGFKNSIAFVKHMLTNLYGDASLEFLKFNEILFSVSTVIIFDWYFRKNERELKTPRNTILRILIYWIMLYLIFNFQTEKQSFIYFQF